MTGRRVLVTAGGAGIGRAMAQAFAAEGDRVFVVDQDEAALADCPAGWRKARLDVTDEDAVAALYRTIETEWGGIDVLCANAGISGPTALGEDVALADWQRTIEVNLTGAFLFVRAVVPGMKARRSGVILLTSSTAGIYGFPNRAPYAAAKWAINGFMKTLTMELGPFGIRANSIAPGAVEGPRMERVLEKEAALKGTTRDVIYRGYADGTSLKSFVTAEDVADMAVFLASDRARMITGQIMAVDGHTENPDPKV